MYLLSPNGSIVRSKARLKREFKQLGVSEADLRLVSKISIYEISFRKLLEFKPEDFNGPDDVKTLEVNIQSGPKLKIEHIPRILMISGCMILRLCLKAGLSKSTHLTPATPKRFKLVLKILSWVKTQKISPDLFYSGSGVQVEEVYHYLTPCRQILRGRRQVFDYLSRC